MSICTNSVSNRKAIRSKINTESHKKGKKKIIISEQEGKELCTYLVDENGHKFLLRRIPIFQEEEKNSDKDINSEKISACDYKMVRNARTTFQSKQLINLETVSEIDIQETMDILKENVGIPSKSKSIIDL